MFITKEDIYELQHKMIADQLLWEAADSCTQGIIYYLCGYERLCKDIA